MCGLTIWFEKSNLVLWRKFVDNHRIIEDKKGERDNWVRPLKYDYSSMFYLSGP